MHIMKYDKNYSRRYFLESMGKSALYAGVVTLTEKWTHKSLSVSFQAAALAVSQA